MVIVIEEKAYSIFAGVEAGMDAMEFIEATVAHSTDLKNSDFKVVQLNVEERHLADEIFRKVKERI